MEAPQGTGKGALELVDLGARLHHRPPQLSGDQQQRVAIARRSRGNPILTLLDEPTDNLDSKNGEEVIDILAVLHDQGAAVLMVIHNQSYAD